MTNPWLFYPPYDIHSYMNKDTPAGWEKEFDEKFGRAVNIFPSSGQSSLQMDIKDFIREEITAAEERAYNNGLLEGEVQGLKDGQRDTLEKVKEMIYKGYDSGEIYTNALQIILSSLEEITKNL